MLRDIAEKWPAEGLISLLTLLDPELNVLAERTDEIDQQSIAVMEQKNSVKYESDLPTPSSPRKRIHYKKNGLVKSAHKFALSGWITGQDVAGSLLILLN